MNASTVKRWVTEGVFIASFPVVGYAVCVAYQSGYAKYFGIPSELITVSIPDIMRVIAILVMSGLVVFSLFDGVYELIPEKAKQSIVVKRLSQFSILFIFFGMLLLLFGLQWTHWMGIGIVLIVFMLGNFALPLLTQKNRPTYEEKLKAQWDIDSKSKSLVSAAIEKHGRANIQLIWGVMMLLLLSYSAGQSEAIRKVDYLVDESKPNTVVLAIYDNKFVEAEFDPMTFVVSRKFIIGCFSDQAEFKFQTQKLALLILLNIDLDLCPPTSFIASALPCWRKRFIAPDGVPNSKVILSFRSELFSISHHTQRRPPLACPARLVQRWAG